jgi:hypothetical protein
MTSETPSTARQLYRALKEGGASEAIIQGIVEQRASHPLDLAAKTMVGLLGVLPRAREGQMGVVLVLRSLLIDTLTLFGEGDPGAMAASEDDLAVARMLLRDVEAIERHLEGPAPPG